MKTIKVIDLLNKIANGEEIPKEIKANDIIYHYDETACNEFYRYRTMTDELLTDYADLNYEVEIIKEKKIPEKLLGEPRHIYNENELYIVDKVNKIIDYLESKEKGE